MTEDRDFDRMARAWLELGPNEAPDRAVFAVLHGVETTRQVRPLSQRLPWRYPTTNRLSLAASLAVAVVAVVVGGLLLSRPGDQRGLAGPPSPAPATSTPTLTDSPTPSVSPTSILPAPTGDQAVGVRDLGAVANGYALRAWYPAEAGTGTPGAPYMSDAAWDALARTLALAPATGSRTDALARLLTPASTDAAPAPLAAPRPVVLLMPGWSVPAATLTILAADLASHGYVVIMIDPPLGSEPAVPSAERNSLLVGIAPARLEALGAALTLIKDPALTDLVGSMDLDRVAVGGHNFGGTLAFLASLGESGVAAVFNLDGGLGYTLPGEGPVSVPALVVVSDGDKVWQTGPSEAKLLRDSKAVVTVGIHGSGHCDLNDLPFFYLAAGTTPTPGSERARCFRMTGAEGPGMVATIVRRFLDAAIGTPSKLPAATDLIKDVPAGYVDPLGLGF